MFCLDHKGQQVFFDKGIYIECRILLGIELSYANLLSFNIEKRSLLKVNYMCCSFLMAIDEVQYASTFEEFEISLRREGDN